MFKSEWRFKLFNPIILLGVVFDGLEKSKRIKLCETGTNKIFSCCFECEIEV